MGNIAVLLSAKPKWTKMIFSGKKPYEFRNQNFRKVVELVKKLKEQSEELKFYFYESLGNPLRYEIYDLDYVHEITVKSDIEARLHFEEYYQNKDKYELSNYRAFAIDRVRKVYEGKGKVVGEAIIDELYKLRSPNDNALEFHRADIMQSNYDVKTGISYYKQIGYTNQPYAIKLKDVVKYDEPLDISKFALWNKYHKAIEGECDDLDCNMCDGNGECSIIINAQEFNKVQRPPQSFCYVLERTNENV